MTRSPTAPAGRARPRIVLCGMLLTALLAGACTSADETEAADGGQDQMRAAEDTTADDAAPDELETPPSTLDEPLAPPTTQSQVAVRGEAPQTTVSSGGGPASSAVEQRVSELLTDLETREGSSGSTSIVLPESILFDFDEAVLKPGADATLAKIAEVIELSEDDRVEVNGHTDARGSDSYNQDLSERRAGAVRDALVADHGISGNRLRAEGFGESQPVAPNTNDDGSDNPQGRKKNRRVEVLVDNISGSD